MAAISIKLSRYFNSTKTYPARSDRFVNMQNLLTNNTHGDDYTKAQLYSQAFQRYLAMADKFKEKLSLLIQNKLTK